MLDSPPYFYPLPQIAFQVYILFTYLFIYFGGKRGECFTHHNAEAPCVGLSPGLASGPKARLDGVPCVLPATSR